MRFSLLGVPVHVRPAFWVVALLLAAPGDLQRFEYPKIASWIAIVFVSVLAHELGHAAAMRSLGRTPRIELWGMGGLTHWGEGPRISGWKRAAVSLAGPTTGFALALPLAIASRWLVLEPGSLEQTVIDQALWVNFGWGALNLLPILPLDGGHVMEVMLTSIAGERGPRLARHASMGVALIVAALAFAWSVPGLGVLALFAGLYALRAPAGDGSIPARASIDPELARALDDAWDAVHQGRADEAIAACDAQLEALPDDEANAAHRARLLETLAWAHLERGDERAARAAAARFPVGRHHPSAVLAARLKIAEGHRDEGLRELERAFQDTPGDLAGLVLAAAYVDDRAPERVVAMLRTLRGARLGDDAHLTMSAALFFADHHEHALAASELAWNRFRDPAHAYNAACACARLGRIDEGLAWIDRARSAGFTDEHKLATDEDLAPLRTDPRWR